MRDYQIYRVWYKPYVNKETVYSIDIKALSLSHATILVSDGGRYVITDVALRSSIPNATKITHTSAATHETLAQ